MTWREPLFFNIVEYGIGLFDFLLRFGLHDSAQAKAQAIEHGGHTAVSLGHAHWSMTHSHTRAISPSW